MRAYAYLTGCGILFVFWLLIYLRRKDLRQGMLWASFIGMPFGVLDFFLVPEYWHPESLFGLINKFGFGIESFLFFFLVSGICSVIYEYVLGKKLKRANGKGRHILAILIPFVFFFAAAPFFPDKAVYVFILAGFIGTLVIVFIRRDLFFPAVFSGILFALFYGFVLYLVVRLFPDFVSNTYNPKNILDIYILGVPLEELLGGLFVGSFWSAAYEYVKRYRIV